MTEIVPSVHRSIAAVVVNYNYEKYVAAAVQSVLNQTMPFDEVIVVDDGSTDGSLQVLRPFADRVRVIAKQNGGPLSAAWVAVAETTSDYLYVLDADDLADPDLVAELQQYLESRPVKVQFQLRSIDPDGEPIDSIFPSYAPDYGSRQMIDDNSRLGFYVCAPTSGNLFRSDYLAYLTSQGLDEREAYDGVPAQLAPYFGEVVSINRPLARYRVHDTSLSQWSRPTPALMEREVERYQNRWTEVLRVLSSKGLSTPDPSRSAFVLERDLMTAALERRRPPLRTAVDYSKAILHSGRSLPQRVAYSTWAVGLVVLPRARAHDLAISKRSVGSRGPLATAVARFSRARTSRRLA